MTLCVVSPQSNGGTGGKETAGGPLYATDDDGSPTQIGVTSYGPLVGHPRAANPDRFASVARMIKWVHSNTGISAATSRSDNIATSLIIDNSGSMSSNDPSRLRLDASKSYIATAIAGDSIGAVGFESYAYDIASITQVARRERGPDDRPR